MLDVVLAMKEREPVIIGSLVALMLILWLGFPFHQSPRFAGSFWGGVLGVSGAVLMLVPLAYLFVKRIKPLKRSLTKHVSMRTLLTWHIYAGVLGPILVLLHTGHKFNSPLGITLTAMVLIVVVSGFIGRYLMSRIGKDLKSKRAMLQEATTHYELALVELRDQPEQAQLIRPFTGFLTRMFMATETLDETSLPGVRAVRLAESIADLEYAIHTHETIKRAFSTWLRFHIVISFVLYALLALHIWAAVHFGIRWFQ